MIRLKSRWRHLANICSHGHYYIALWYLRKVGHVLLACADSQLWSILGILIRYHHWAWKSRGVAVFIILIVVTTLLCLIPPSARRDEFRSIEPFVCCYNHGSNILIFYFNWFGIEILVCRDVARVESSVGITSFLILCHWKPFPFWAVVWLWPSWGSILMDGSKHFHEFYFYL